VLGAAPRGSPPGRRTSWSSRRSGCRGSAPIFATPCAAPPPTVSGEWSPCRHLRLTSRESGVDGQSGLRRLRGSGTGPAGRRDRDTSPARSRRISRYDREQPSDAD
jgi:hypothetical protein